MREEKPTILNLHSKTVFVPFHKLGPIHTFHTFNHSGLKVAPCVHTLTLENGDFEKRGVGLDAAWLDRSFGRISDAKNLSLKRPKNWILCSNYEIQASFTSNTIPHACVCTRFLPPRFAARKRLFCFLYSGA